MRMWSRVVLPSVLVLLAGCATSFGTPVAQEKLGQIREGVSTKADVIRLLGQPSAIDMNSDGSEVLKYQSSKFAMDAANFIPIVGPFVGKRNYKQQSIQILVNKKGIVEKYTATEPDAPMAYGLQ